MGTTSGMRKSMQIINLSNVELEKDVLNTAISSVVGDYRDIFNPIFDRIVPEIFREKKHQEIAYEWQEHNRPGWDVFVPSLCTYDNPLYLEIYDHLGQAKTLPETELEKAVAILEDLAERRKYRDLGQSLCDEVSTCESLRDVVGRFKDRLQDIGEASAERGELCVHLSDEVPSPIYLLDVQGTGIITKGDLHGLIGKEKSGKSFAGYMMAAALLSGEYEGLRAMYDNVRVVIIDTEQNISFFLERLRNTFAKAGLWSEGQPEEPARCSFYSFRGIGRKDRLLALEKIALKEKPDFVFLDGLVDLCGNINDEAETQSLVQKVMEIADANNCAIVCVLHENKNDTNPRGHLGSFLRQKCAEEWKVSSDGDNVRKVSQTLCKGKPAKPWAFIINETGAPVCVNYEARVSVDEAEKLRKQVVSAIERITGDPLLVYDVEVDTAALKQKLSEVTGNKERSSSELISNAVKHGVLERVKQGFYRLANDKTETQKLIPEGDPLCKMQMQV
jgi:hypothetical protein